MSEFGALKINAISEVDAEKWNEVVDCLEVVNGKIPKERWKFDDLIIDNETTSSALHLRSNNQKDSYISNRNNFRDNATTENRNLTISSDNKILLQTGGEGNIGLNRLVIDAEGNIGIGTDEPSHKLEINGSAKANTLKTRYLDFGHKNTNYQYIRFGTEDAHYFGLMHNIKHEGYGSKDSLTIFTYGDRGINIRPGVNKSTNFIRGNVGINTITPDTKLHVKTEDHGNAIRIEGDERNLYIQSDEIYATEKDLHINTNSNSKNLLLVNGGGNVGVNTRSPQAKLHIEGSVYAKSFSVNTKLIEFKRYSSDKFKLYSSDNLKKGLNGGLGRWSPIPTIGNFQGVNTNIDANIWDAGVIGIDTGIVDIQENDAGLFLRTRMQVYEVKEGNKTVKKWFVMGALRSHKDHENWTIDVMFVRKSISKRGYDN